MRIAIVDDIASERQLLRNRLDTLLFRRLLHAEIFEYENGDSFLAACREERFTLTFLDIYMEGINGVETAQQLREFDPECLLVYITTSTDHALDGFRVRAMQYLVKPYSTDELDAVLEEAIKRLPAADRYIDLHTGGSPVRLFLHDILYVEHFQHQVFIYTVRNQTFTIRRTLRQFTADLNDSRFVPCNRGTIVNLDHVDDFDGNAFLLKSGKTIPVSRNLAGTARQAFADFLFQRRA